MSKIYIYGLSTTVFNSKQDYFDASPADEYFYVGHTKDLKKRKTDHASKARNNSTYPYHKKIRESGTNWDIMELDSVDESQYSDHEEYYIYKLTAEGHPLLNIKRGNKNREKATDMMQQLTTNGIANAAEYSQLKKDYSKVELKNRQERIEDRERRQINKSLKFLGPVAGDPEHVNWQLGDEILVAEKYVSRKEMVEQHLPSKVKALNELLIKGKIFLDSIHQS